MSQNRGSYGGKRQHHKVPGAFYFWENIKREYKGRMIPAGTRAPGSHISKRTKEKIA